MFVNAWRSLRETHRDHCEKRLDITVRNSQRSSRETHRDHCAKLTEISVKTHKDHCESSQRSLREIRGDLHRHLNRNNRTDACSPSRPSQKPSSRIIFSGIPVMNLRPSLKGDMNNHFQRIILRLHNWRSGAEWLNYPCLRYYHHPFVQITAGLTPM
jgi:hypothetical protein